MANFELTNPKIELKSVTGNILELRDKVVPLEIPITYAPTVNSTCEVTLTSGEVTLTSGYVYTNAITKRWNLQNDSDTNFEKFNIKHVHIDYMSKTISMKIESLHNDDDVVKVALLKWINKFSGKPEGQYTRETYLNLAHMNTKGEVLYRVLSKNLRLQRFQLELECPNYSWGRYCLEFGATNIDMEFPK